MDKAKLQTFLERIESKMHIPIALFIFLVCSVYHFKTGKDLGPQYVNSIYATYAFLGGHYFCNAKWGGGDPPAPPAGQ